MKKRFWYVILSVLGGLGAIIAMIQFVMAIYFREFGRVVFYFMLAAVLAELAVWAMLKLRKVKK